MNNLHVFVPYHQPEMLSRVPQRPWLTKILLGDLKIDPPEYQDNRLGEGRLFLSNLEHPPGAEWVGVLNARCPEKYVKFDWDTVPVAIGDGLDPRAVFAPWPTLNGWSNDWLRYSESVHPGMESLLNQLTPGPIQSVRRRPSLWGNDFVCHRTVWDRWLDFWRQCFFYHHTVYGFDPPFACDPKYNGRKPALLYERVTTLFFALWDFTIYPISGGIRA